MILRRFSQAIANQSWGTVVLELLVVIVGIFLGLQVDDWNERRKELRLESVYLEKLRDDLVEMQSMLGEKVSFGDESIRRMSAALTALEQCTESEQARADLDFALTRYQIVPPLNYLNATYDEMVTTGALARLDDQELKQAITYAFGHLAELNANQRSFRVSMPVVDSIVWSTVSFSLDPESGRPSVTYDMNSLCTNVELRNAIVEMIDIQWDSRSSASRSLESVDRLIVILGDRSENDRS